MRATQLKIQASSECCGTADWLKTICFLGSMPEAMKAAAIERIGGIKLLPQLQQRPVRAGIGHILFVQLLAARDRIGGVATDAGFVLLLVFFAQV